MFVRYVVHRRDHQSLRKQGIIQAAVALRDGGHMTPYEEQWYDRIERWFNRHLAAPTRLARSRRPGAHENAIFWFRDSAKAHLRMARELAELLEYMGQPTEMIVTWRPGYVVYEDRHQVAAVPFARETFVTAA